MKKENKQLHKDYVNEIWKRELSNFQALDKAILTLSSASLGFSLTAIELENSEYLPLMFVSWGLLIITIAISLLSFVIANKILNKSIESSENYYLRDQEDASDKKDILNYFYYISIVCLLVAIIMIAIFKILNL